MANGKWKLKMENGYYVLWLRQRQCAMRIRNVGKEVGKGRRGSVRLTAGLKIDQAEKRTRESKEKRNCRRTAKRIDRKSTVKIEADESI